jgi:hypothetical protein
MTKASRYFRSDARACELLLVKTDLMLERKSTARGVATGICRQAVGRGRERNYPRPQQEDFWEKDRGKREHI